MQVKYPSLRSELAYLTHPALLAGNADHIARQPHVLIARMGGYSQATRSNYAVLLTVTGSSPTDLAEALMEHTATGEVALETLIYDFSEGVEVLRTARNRLR